MVLKLYLDSVFSDCLCLGIVGLIMGDIHAVEKMVDATSDSAKTAFEVRSD